jgi:hypothetical protein
MILSGDNTRTQQKSARVDTSVYSAGMAVDDAPSAVDITWTNGGPRERSRGPGRRAGAT